MSQAKKLKWKKYKSKKKLISFQDEIVTKDEAEKILNTKNQQNVNNNNSHHLENKLRKKKGKRGQKKKSVSNGNDEIEKEFNIKESYDETTKNAEEPSLGEVIRKKKKKRKADDEESKTAEEPVLVEVPKKKKKKRKADDEEIEESATKDIRSDSQIASESEDHTEESVGEVKKEKKSNRQRKRERYKKTLEERKVQTDLESQMKTLNYLSQWKHNRSGWKFEKLKQIWLQKNVYDSSKIPDRLWDTFIEYFSNAHGHVKGVLIKEATSVLNKEQDQDIKETEEENENNSDTCKVKRARDILQFLQE